LNGRERWPDPRRTRIGDREFTVLGGNQVVDAIPKRTEIVSGGVGG